MRWRQPKAWVAFMQQLPVWPLSRSDHRNWSSDKEGHSAIGQARPVILQPNLLCSAAISVCFMIQFCKDSLQELAYASVLKLLND
jgi:hypothetical protein